MNREQKIIIALAIALFLACNIIACLSGLFVGRWSALIAGRLDRGTAELDNQPLEPQVRQLTPDTSIEPPATPEEISFAALVTQVVEEGPAAQAGIRTGDLILAIDSKRFIDEEDLGALLAGYRPGDRVTLTIERRNVEKEVQVELGAHPRNRQQPYLGLTYRLVPRVR